MRDRDLLGRGEPGISLPILDRIAPSPPRDLVAARIEAHTVPGDVVLDPNGRGGWIARSAIDLQRKAISIETGPLHRLLAEVVLRPPDIRHLDATFQSIAASPREQTNLKLAVQAPFATRCATCGKSLYAAEIAWGPAPAEHDESHARSVPIRKHYRCTVCRDQQRGGEHRQAPLDDDDRERAAPLAEAEAARAKIRDRFPVSLATVELVEAIVGLHTDRQIVGLAAILERIEADERPDPLTAALRVALVEAILPASRLATGRGRLAPLRISHGRLKPGPEAWKERNPWLAFEDGFRLVRAFVHALGNGDEPVQARVGTEIRSLAEGSATAAVRVAAGTNLKALEAEIREVTGRPVRPRLRLIIGEPPAPIGPEALALTWHATAWVLGRNAASLVPIESLLGTGGKVTSGWRVAALSRSLELAEPLLDREGRAVLVVDGDAPEGLVAAALGAAAAGFRLAEASLGGPADRPGELVLVPPGAVVPPRARTRANVALPPLPGGAGDPEVVPAAGLFAPPERVDARAFSAPEAARTVTEAAVAVLQERGEAAPTGRLLGDVLVGLDRTGQLRRLVRSLPPRDTAAPPAASGRARRHDAVAAGSSDPVERLLAVIHDELHRPAQHRLVEVEPDLWWLGEREDRAAAAAPLADRVEWAVFSLLSTGSPLSEASFVARIAGLFGPGERPDEALLRACVESYRSPDASSDRLFTDEDLLRRSSQHGEVLAAIAAAGHRLGMQVWLARREQSRRLGSRRLGEWLDETERTAHLPSIVFGPPDEVEAIDCIWYVRNRAGFLFEVEWTAMLGDAIVRRHGRIPADERLVRFLVIPDERTELVRHKLDRSAVLRSTFEAGNWHVLKWSHLGTFLGTEPLDLGALEPLLGLDPAIERTNEQLPLFVGAAVGQAAPAGGLP